MSKLVLDKISTVIDRPKSAPERHVAELLKQGGTFYTQQFHVIGRQSTSSLSQLETIKLLFDMQYDTTLLA